MRFIVSDSMELEHGFGKWHYSHDEGVRSWSDGERLCLYYGYTIDGELEQLVRGEPEFIPDANGKFCVVMLWKDRMQVWVDYFCQSKVYYHTRDGLTVTNHIALLPLHQEDVDRAVVNRFAKGIHRHGGVSCAIDNSGVDNYNFLKEWEHFTTNNTVFHMTASVPPEHCLQHIDGDTKTVRTYDTKRDIADALSHTLDWGTAQLEDKIHQCMDQHSSVIKKNYRNICSTISEGIDSVLQDMYFGNVSRLMYHPFNNFFDADAHDRSLSWKTKIISQFEGRGVDVRLDLMPMSELGVLTERHAVDVNLSFLDIVPTLWQISKALPEKPQLILYGQNADEMFLHRMRFIRTLHPREDVSRYRGSYADGDRAPVKTPTGEAWRDNMAHMAELNLYNRDVENQTGVQTTSLYSDRRIFNLVHRMPRPVMLESMAHAAPQRNILQDRFGFDFQTPSKDAAGYRCNEVLKRLLKQTLGRCLLDHSL